MKFKKILLSLIYMGALFYSNCQTTLTLQPDGTRGKDAHISSYLQGGNANFGNGPRISARAIPQNGSLRLFRGLIDFDLTQIPSDVIIIDAKLTLTPPNANPNLIAGNNALLISKIKDPWDEQLVTWNNQPLIDPSLQTSLATSSLATTYQNIDVTQHIIDRHNHPTTNFGMRLEMANEVAPIKSLVFASSDIQTSNLRPKLEVTYVPAQILNCGALSIDADDMMTVPSVPGLVTYTIKLHDNQGNLLDSYVSNNPYFNLSHFLNTVISPLTTYQISVQITDSYGLNIQGQPCDITTDNYIKPQNPYMCVGDSYWDMTNNSLVNLPIVSGSGDTPTAVIKDDCGNIKFFFHGSRIRDQNGTTIYNVIGLQLAEVEIVPIPTQPDHYYFIYHRVQISQNLLGGLFYFTIDASGTTPVIGTPTSLNADIYGSIAVSNNSEANTRFLYSLENGKLVRYLINSTGIGNPAAVMSNIGSKDILEMDLSHDDTKLAWIEADNAGNDLLSVVTLEPFFGTFLSIYNTLLPGNGYIDGQGVEFDKTGDKLYITIGNETIDSDNGLYKVDLINNIIQKIPGTDDYRNTILEMGWDGNIYAAEYSTSVVKKVGYIDQDDLFHSNIFTTAIPQSWLTNAAMLPQQIDGQIYNNPNNPNVNANFSINSTVCENGPILLDGRMSQFGTSYTINVSTTGNNVTVWQKTYSGNPGIIDLGPELTPLSGFQCGATYNVSLDVQNGCATDSHYQNIYVECTSNQTVSASGCNVDPVSLTTFFGSLNTYQWLNGNAPIPNANSAGYNVTGSGCYAVSVTSNNGCKSTSPEVGIGYDFPGAGPDVTICSGKTINLGDVNGYPCNSDFSYQWYRFVVVGVPNGPLALIPLIMTGETSPQLAISHNISANSTETFEYKVIVTDNQTGCSQEDRVKVTVIGNNHINCQISNIVSKKDTQVLDETILETQISIHPNPSNSGVFIVQTSGLSSNKIIYVIDVTGKQVIKQMMNDNQSKIDLSSYSKGLYFVKVIDGTNQKVHKIIYQ